jgi:hypothetical protein
MEKYHPPVRMATVLAAVSATMATHVPTTRARMAIASTRRRFAMMEIPAQMIHAQTAIVSIQRILRPAMTEMHAQREMPVQMAFVNPVPKRSAMMAIPVLMTHAQMAIAYLPPMEIVAAGAILAADVMTAIPVMVRRFVILFMAACQEMLQTAMMGTLVPLTPVIRQQVAASTIDWYAMTGWKNVKTVNVYAVGLILNAKLELAGIYPRVTCIVVLAEMPVLQGKDVAPEDAFPSVNLDKNGVMIDAFILLWIPITVENVGMFAQKVLLVRMDSA